MITLGASGNMSANDCFCLVTAQVHSEANLLTGDRLLRRVAEDNGIDAHSVLWVDALNEGRKTGALVLGAGVGLTTQKSAASTPVPRNEFFGD